MILLYLLSACVILSPEWTTFKSIEGKFQIEVPGEMEHTIQQIETDLGTINYHTFYLASLSDTSGNFVYMVSFYRSPSLLVPEDSIGLIGDFFDATVEQAAHSVSGEVLILDEIRYQNRYPGRFWRIHYNGGRSVLKTKAYLVDDTFYSIQVAVDASFGLSNEVDRFMNSFKLIDTIN